MDAEVLHYSHPSDVKDLLEEVNSKDEGANYYPFPSKLFFFLYLLIHSPHPIVGHD